MSELGQSWIGYDFGERFVFGIYDDWTGRGYQSVWYNCKRFRFNLARNFVRAGLGYSSLTGQGDVYLAGKMILVTSREGFGGVKVFGFDTSLIAGRLKATCECPQKHYFTASVHQNGKLLVRNDPEKETSLPQNDPWKFATAEVSADGFGKFGANDVVDPEGWDCEARRYYFGIYPEWSENRECNFGCFN